jgi:hypothetical protein
VSAPSIQFTPLNGLLSIGKKLAEQFGMGGMWAGEDGFEGVARQKLIELGVPDKAVDLAGPGAMTPRQLCEESGFIKRRGRSRGVK